MNESRDTTRTTHRHRPRRATPRDHDDRGVTLVELLVSMTLLATAGVAVLVAVATSARAASVHRQVASVQAQLASVGDHLMSTDSPYKSCAAAEYRIPDPDVVGAEVVDSPMAHEGVRAFYDAHVADVAATFPSFADVQVTDVQFWDGTEEEWGATCWALFQGDRIQRIRLEVAAAGVATNTLDVVKRPPSGDEPVTGIVTPPPRGSAGGGGSGGGGGSFTPNPCIEGCP